MIVLLAYGAGGHTLASVNALSIEVPSPCEKDLSCLLSPWQANERDMVLGQTITETGHYRVFIKKTTSAGDMWWGRPRIANHENTLSQFSNTALQFQNDCSYQHLDIPPPPA